jgi:endonuclease/exonuclease/phosphatase family metal-dependent hydrolase
MSRVLSLNTCLLPTHLRWIFRAHRGAESLGTATARVASVLGAADRASPVDVIHLQEVFSAESLRALAGALPAFPYVTPHAASGVATLSRHPLRVLDVRETRRPPFAPKGWAVVEVRAAGSARVEVHVNCHLASEIDGSHRARIAQAQAIREWLCVDGRERALVVGDLNEPDGEGAERLACALGAVPLPAAAMREDTYCWLGGLVRGRLDRAYVIGGTRVAADGGEAGCGEAIVGRPRLGVELAGRVRHGLDDVSDHLPVEFTFDT